MSDPIEHIVNLEHELSLLVSESHITDPAVFAKYGDTHDAIRGLRTAIEQSRDKKGAADGTC